MEKYAFFEKRKEQMAWQFRQLIVDAPLFWFYCRNHKSDSKEKANSPASYTFCMAKKDLFYWRLGWRRSDKRCSVAVYYPTSTRRHGNFVGVHTLLRILLSSNSAVLINIITGVSPPHFDFFVYYVLCQC
jgi:hypothetical protein